MLCSGQYCSFWDSFACSCFEFFHNGHVPSDKPNKGCKVGFRRGVNGWKKLLRSEKLRSCTINNAKHAKIFEKRSFDWTVNDLISQFCVWKSFTQTCSKRKWPTEVSGQSKRTFYHSGRGHTQTNQSWLWWRFFFFRACSRLHDFAWDYDWSLQWLPLSLHPKHYLKVKIRVFSFHHYTLLWGIFFRSLLAFFFPLFLRYCSSFPEDFNFWNFSASSSFFLTAVKGKNRKKTDQHLTETEWQVTS